MHHRIKSFFEKPIAIFIAAAILSIVPTIAIFYKIATGDISFWYDPARDLLSSLENLHKPTLIGPPSGIPGVFYGPYWIWLLSFGLIFSQDPRLVTIVVLTIPYFILFPFILSRFSKIIGWHTIAILWLLFLLTSQKYFTNLWNPHPSLLIILLSIYLFFIKTTAKSFKNSLITFFAGFTTGLVMNFQLSFGIGMLLGMTFYLLGESIVYLVAAKKKLEALLLRISIMVLFVLGCIISFTPFLVFEFRHNFLQTKTLINAFTHFGAVVDLTGLTKPQILQVFFNQISNVLHLTFIPAMISFIIITVFYIYSYRKRGDQVKSKEIKLISILVAITSGIMYLYLTAKNPIWDYHFIGFEPLILLLIGIFIDRAKALKIIITLWIVVLVANYTFDFIKGFRHEPKHIEGNLAAVEEVAKKIQKESDNKDYEVFAYSQSIYIYEYSYLFKWLNQKDVPFDPGQVRPGSSLVYVIIPNSAKNMYNSYIEYRAPGKQYKTAKSWKMSDGTAIVQRVKIIK